MSIEHSQKENHKTIYKFDINIRIYMCSGMNSCFQKKKTAQKKWLPSTFAHNHRRELINKNTELWIFFFSFVVILLHLFLLLLLLFSFFFPCAVGSLTYCSSSMISSSKEHRIIIIYLLSVLFSFFNIFFLAAQSHSELCIFVSPGESLFPKKTKIK